MVKQAGTAEQQRPHVHICLTPITGSARHEHERRSSSTSEQQQQHLADTHADRLANVETCEDGTATGRAKKAAFRLACYRCKCLMEFDPGSRFVQCYKCFAINAVLPTKGGRRRHDGVEVLGVICPCCLTTNLVSCRARLVRCNICSTISAAPAYVAAAASSSCASSSSPSSSVSPFPRELLFSQSSPP